MTTIVVLIILATVSINLTIGNNGIFQRAKIAKEQYQNAQDYEKEQIAKTTNDIDTHVNASRDYESEISRLNERIAELENLNSYSTTEKIIGTWVDGKPLYQKTIICAIEDKTTITKNSCEQTVYNFLKPMNI